MTKVYTAYAPASAANLSVGFDLLGAALRPVSGAVLGDRVSVCEDNSIDGCKVQTVGRFAHKLPEDFTKNIVYIAYNLYARTLADKGAKAKNLKMRLEKNLPVCSGLGSSASSVVAAVAALDAAHDDFLGRDGMLKLMGQLEGQISGSIHYDNVAPCFFGGLQLVTGFDSQVSLTLRSFDSWLWVSCFPGIRVSTSKARAILPAQYLRSDVITFGRNLSAFVHACHTQDEKLACQCLYDVIAEPYRASLIPGFDNAREYGRAHGALATGISGSGSSIFSIYTDMDKAREMKEYLERNFIDNEDGFCHICTIDKEGCTVTVSDE